jgi:quercetin dioxygenase-like cupin family protein
LLRQLRTLLPSILLVATVGTVGVPAAGQTPAPTPVNVATKAFPITLAAGDYELVNQVLDFPPGSGVPQHFHGGPAVVTVLTGELVTADANGERVLKAGDSLLEGSGDKHSVINKTDGTVRVAVSYLVPKSAQRTTLIK